MAPHHLRSHAAPAGAGEWAGYLPVPGPGHRPGLHHRYRQHRWGGYRHLVRRAGGGVLDVGLRPAGHDDRVRGEAALRALPPRRPRRVAGRAHVLHPGRPEKPAAGGLVCPGMPAGHPDRGRHGPVQLHCRRPPGHLWMGPAGGGGGRRGPDGAGDGGGDRTHRPGEQRSGPGDGAALSGGRGGGAGCPGRPDPGGDGTDLLLGAPTGGRSRGRNGIHPGCRSAVRGGPGGVHQ